MEECLRFLAGFVLIFRFKNIALTDATSLFLKEPGDFVKCPGDDVFFRWTYVNNSTLRAISVEWTKDGMRIALENLLAGDPPAPVPTYKGRLTHGSNADVTLHAISAADSGNYSCTVTYVNGQSSTSQGSLTVYSCSGPQTYVEVHRNVCIVFIQSSIAGPRFVLRDSTQPICYQLNADDTFYYTNSWNKSFSCFANSSHVLVCLNDAKPEDTGNFYFRVGPTVISNSKLLVLYPLKVLEFQDVDVLEGSDFNITCAVMLGYPREYTVQWKDVNDNFIQNGNALIIDSIRRSSAGSYTCVAENRYPTGNGGSSNATVRINVLYFPQVLPLSDVQIFEFSDLIVPCQILPGNPELNLNVYWNRLNDSDFRQSGAVLSLYQIKRFQSGVYTCNAENMASKDLQFTQFSTLNVDVLYVPTVQINGSTIMGLVGQRDVILACFITDGRPSSGLMFSWTKGNEVVSNSSIYTISRLRRSDDGVYSCTARNIVGLSPPVFVKIDITNIFVSIDAKFKTLVLGKDGLTISCFIAKKYSVQTIKEISLIKNNVIVVSINQSTNTVKWHSALFGSRKGVNASGNISSVDNAYLHFTISANETICPEDEAEYTCKSIATDQMSEHREDQTDAVSITFIEPPSKMSEIGIHVKGKSNTQQREPNTQQREFHSNTVLQLQCQGDTGTQNYSQSESIRWCIEFLDSTNFTKISHQPVISNIVRDKCQYRITSTIELTVSTDIRVLCESGYTSTCGSGSAKSAVKILALKDSVQSPSTSPSLYVGITLLSIAVLLITGAAIFIYVKLKRILGGFSNGPSEMFDHQRLSNLRTKDIQKISVQDISTQTDEKMMDLSTSKLNQSGAYEELREGTEGMSVYRRLQQSSNSVHHYEMAH